VGIFQEKPEVEADKGGGRGFTHPDLPPSHPLYTSYNPHTPLIHPHQTPYTPFIHP